MQNNFPRIFSLSTIGIKQHFNADYLFHPYRTDFSGESGSGKSMIADMIQLILIGSSEFKSATDGNKDRDVKGMLLVNKGKSSSRGYIFLNIEVNPKQYLVIGVYIESTSNVAEMFIIQNGYDWDTITPLNNPIFYKDLLINDKVETLNSLSEKIEFAQIKSFKRRAYHQILYNNDILSLDLTSDETLKTYASILRSFSRGKGFKTESENLKKFLFGDDDQNVIMRKYNEEVNNINNDFHEHKRYLEEIELINNKQNVLKDILEKNKSFKSVYTEYLIQRYNYWNTSKKKNTEKLKKVSEELCITENELQCLEIQLIQLRIKDLKELLDNKKKVNDLSHLSDSNLVLEQEFLTIKQSKTNIEIVEKWLFANENQIDNVKIWYHSQKSEEKSRSELVEFTNYLSNNNIIKEFEASNWLIDFDKESSFFDKDIKKLEKEITELESLSKFSDVNNPESLLRWTTENLTFPVSHTTESVLVYFQKFGKLKPSEKNAERYVPYPEELFNDIDNKIKDKSQHGFWLNLDGVYEFIEYSPNPVLNVTDHTLITKPLLKLKENFKTQLEKLILEKQNKENLKNILFEFSNLKLHVELYQRRDKIAKFNIEESIKELTQESFEKCIQLFENKENILKKHDSIQKKYQDSLNQKTIIDGHLNKIKELESNLFDKDENVDIEFVEKKIIEVSKSLLELSEILKQKNFDIELFLKKQSNITKSKIAVLELKLTLQNSLKNLEKKKEENENLLSFTSQEINEVISTNEQLFKSKIEFDDNYLELINPSEGGKNSLAHKAEQAKISYEENLKIIIKDLPYDETVSIGQLANYFLPTVFPTSKIDEDLITFNITERLNKLTRDIQEIGSRKVEILGSIFNEVYNVYSGYLTKINVIDGYLQKKNKVITGGNRASLTAKKSFYYPDNWLSSFRKQLNNQLSFTGLFTELKEEIDINEMMIKAFRQLGGSVKVEPQDLMNPKSYFDLEFDLKLDND
ncbi:hypothetical protein [Flavobacterium sp.]|uniref:hypothetical protein n=1 Tax=Flavobacterium sp. TaxID=239 RepID=UPI002623EF3A|nr:hypothetical protein [Flavobacterium sp.]